MLPWNLLGTNDHIWAKEFIENVKTIAENFTRMFGYLSVSEDEGATSRNCEKI